MIEYPDELDDTSECVDCGAVLWSDVSRAFTCGPDVVLCFDCAERRGGVYDSDEDRWTRPPDLSGLPCGEDRAPL